MRTFGELVKRLVALAAATAIAAGCSGGLDVEALERQIELDLAADLSDRYGTVAVEQVGCPPVVFPAEGDSVTVRCSARIEQQAATIEVAVSRTDRTAIAQVVDRLIDTSTVEQLVAERFATDLSIPTGVNCPVAVAVVPIGGELTCTAVDVRGIERSLVLIVGPSEELTIRLG